MTEPLVSAPKAAVQPLAAAWPWRAAALAWLAVVLVVAVHQVRFWTAGRLDTDVMALLPATEQDVALTRATEQLGQGLQRQIVVLLGAPDAADVRRAAAAWRAQLLSDKAPLGEVEEQGADGAQFVAFQRRWRDRLLTPVQRERLLHSPGAALTQSALAQLHQPGASAREWAGDPLGLGSEWLLARAGQSKARPRGDGLWVTGEGAEWQVLRYEIGGTAFSMSGDARYGPALEAAWQAARREVPELRMLAVGLPLHAEAAATRASWEINTIGWGSLGCVLLLAWLAFRSPWPMALVGASLVIGTAAGLSLTAAVFGQVHLLTLVFGASLVGVAEDYGIHYFAARQGRPEVPQKMLMRALLPGLALALSTSVLAYLALGLAPFPGLRQMAVFSAGGLAGAFLTAVCWFPLLDRRPPRASRFAAVIAGSLARWPRAAGHPGVWIIAGALALFTAAGLVQLRAGDDLRNWQSSPRPLVEAQMQVNRLLGMPSVAQFYLVQGASAQEVLEREEALKARLDPLVGPAGLQGYVAVSDWVPSLARQREDAALVARAEAQVVAGVNAALGEAIARPGPSVEPLTPQAWLADPVSRVAGRLWLGESEGRWSTLVLLQGLHGRELLPRLAETASQLPGVRWVDRSADVAVLLGRYRGAMTALLLAGHLAVFAALWWRFRSRAWRAWLPTAAASALTAGCLGWLGEPLQLANVLALLLLLGMGVDYGIFLVEHDGDGSAWLAVVLGAASTWLAFGLLAWSSTPVLHAFGLTLMIGIAAVWVLSPWLRPPPRVPP